MTSRWIAEFVGYPQAAGGILVSGGTMANFTAVLTALRHVAPYDSTPGAGGLLAAGLTETGELFRGLERADSLSVDAHKWLGVPHDCGVVLVRQREHLRRAFSIAAPYLGEDPEGEGATDYRDYGPQMSRAFRALKVWMVLRSFGAAGLREVLSKSLRLARHLHGLVGEHPDFEVLHDASAAG